MGESPPWRIAITPRAQRQLQRIAADQRLRLAAALDKLSRAPFEGDVRKLQGAANEWRLRVGDWRIRFELDSQARVVFILQVLPRGRAYRD